MNLPKTGRSLSALASMLIFPMLAQAGTFKTIYTFAGGNDAAAPQSALIYNNGALYGTTSRGGPNDAGTVYTYNLATNVESVLTTTMGLLPYTPVTLVGDKLYGTTSAADNGSGNIFDYNLKTGVTTDLHAFPQSRDLAYPGGLVKLGGNLYGTTTNSGNFDYGSIFQYNLKTGVFTTLYAFTGGADGKGPSQLVAKNGILYGVTARGGANGDGAIFTYNPTTSTEKTVYSFSGAADGNSPSGLTFHQGLIFGTALFGGANNQGTIFKMDPATNTVSVVYNLIGGSEGCLPAGSPAIIGGMLYSIAASCGSTANQGTLFSVKLSNAKEKTLHIFTNGADGVSPGAGLLLNQGIIYGTASYGGANNAGTIFQYVP
jgi:uncharacterized repeat protein (TIGR03803 family)